MGNTCSNNDTVASSKMRAASSYTSIPAVSRSSGRQSVKVPGSSDKLLASSEQPRNSNSAKLIRKSRKGDLITPTNSMDEDGDRDDNDSGSFHIGLWKGKLGLMRKFYDWDEIPLDFFVDKHVKDGYGDKTPESTPKVRPRLSARIETMNKQRQIRNGLSLHKSELLPELKERRASRMSDIDRRSINSRQSVSRERGSVSRSSNKLNKATSSGKQSGGRRHRPHSTKPPAVSRPNSRHRYSVQGVIRRAPSAPHPTHRRSSVIPPNVRLAQFMKRFENGEFSTKPGGRDRSVSDVM